MIENRLLKINLKLQERKTNLSCLDILSVNCKFSAGKKQQHVIMSFRIINAKCVSAFLSEEKWIAKAAER